MTKKEMNGVWRFLCQYRKNDPKCRDDELLSAWWKNFGRYDAETVENAIVEYYQSSKYWPDIPEIQVRLPKLPPQRDMRGYQPDEVIAELWDIFLTEINPKIKAAGLPVDIMEAKRAGLSPDEYMNLLDEHHLGFDDAWVRVEARMRARKEAACCGNGLES